MNQRIIDNLRRAIAVFSQVPEKAVDLETFKNKCGTHACLAGHLAMDQFFQAQGMVLAHPDIYAQHWHLFKNGVVPEVGRYYDFDWLDELFGENAFCRLFDTYAEGEFDRHILGENDWHYYQDTGDRENVLSDKQLALKRLYRQLDEMLAKVPA